MTAPIFDLILKRIGLDCVDMHLNDHNHECWIDKIKSLLALTGHHIDDAGDPDYPIDAKDCLLHYGCWVY